MCDPVAGWIKGHRQVNLPAFGAYIQADIALDTAGERAFGSWILEPLGSTMPETVIMSSITSSTPNH